MESTVSHFAVNLLSAPHQADQRCLRNIKVTVNVARTRCRVIGVTLEISSVGDVVVVLTPVVSVQQKIRNVENVRE